MALAGAEFRELMLLSVLASFQESAWALASVSFQESLSATR